MVDQNQNLNQPNPEQQQQRLQGFNQNIQQKFAQEVEELHYESAITALQESLDAYKEIAIKRAFKRFKKDSQELLQNELQQSSDYLGEKLIEHRASLPQEEDEDDTPQLGRPSLEESIDKAHSNYGVLASSEDNQNQLPDDVKHLF